MGKEIDSMMEAWIIQPSISAWALPTVLVSMKDGGICFVWITAVKLSKSTFDAYPMLHVEELLRR